MSEESGRAVAGEAELGKRMAQSGLGRILVVDDEVELTHALVDRLTAAGYTVEGYTSPLAALAALRQTPFDVLLTDLMMPGTDGIALLQAGLEVDPNLVGIMMTGQATVQSAVDAMRGGAYDYVLKPFKLAALQPVLARAMDVRRLRTENLQLRETVAIHMLSQAIALTLDLPAILAETTSAVLQQCAADEVSILLLSSAGDELVVAAAHGEGREAILDHRVPIGQDIAGWVAQWKEPLILNGPVDDPRFKPLYPRPAIQSAICMPMLARGKLVGVINVSSLRERRPFTAGQVKALSILANTAAAALENARLYRILHANEQRFRALIENSSDGIILFDAAGTVKYVSPSGLKLWGYDREAVIGRSAFEFVHAEDVLHAQALLAELVGQAQPVITGELRVRHGDGTWHWIEFTTQNLLAMPDVNAFVSNFRDITQRKQAEDRLRLSDEVLQRVRSIILVGDGQGRIVYANPYVSEALGYPPETLYGDGWWQFSRPDPAERERDRAFFASVARQETPVIDEPYEGIVPTRDGSHRHIVWQDALGPGRTVIGVGHDITELKQAAVALETEHNLLSTLVNALPDQVAVRDTQGRFLLVNQAFADYQGSSDPDAYLGRSLREVFPPKQAADYRNEDQRVLATGQSVLNSEIASLDPTGQPRSHLLTKVPLHDAAGNAWGVVSIARDITDLKQAAEAQAESEERFRQMAENIRDVFTIWDQRERRPLYVSPAYAEIWGLPVQVIYDTPQTFLKTVHSDDHEQVKAMLAQQDAGVVTSIEYRIVRPDGEVRWVRDRSFPIRDASGAVYRVAAVVEDITQQKLAEAEIERQLERLQAIRTVDVAITASLDLRVTLAILLEEVTKQLGVHAADILLLEPGTQFLHCVAARGLRANVVHRGRRSVSDWPAWRAAVERQTVFVRDLRAASRDLDPADLSASDNVVSYIGVPLVAKGEIKGVLEIYHRAPLEPDSDWLNFLEALAHQAAIAIDNAQLFERLQRSNTELVISYDATLEGWSRAMDLRDKETEGHSQRVTEMTLHLGRVLGISVAELVHVRRGALLHDVGKLGIPDSILLKPGPLTGDEWEVMKKHPVYAYQMLSPIAYLHPALDIPYCHHEKWDGTGYPRGLKGEEIPLAARVFAVVDVWDALTSDRPYRPAWPASRARDHIQSQAGAHFDPRVVEVFLALDLSALNPLPVLRHSMRSD